MPVNRTFNTSPRRHGARRFPTQFESRFDNGLGIRLIHIERTARTDVVARGRLLAASANYPPPHVVNAIAELIAHHVRI